jgi:alkanesulfonate monooxygenase SsuD/methylene tetrahydromethanopterin reductase-like flavin-dependent oxidoreductase (luciferase family)
MRYGFVIPGGDARLSAELAAEAEAAGWDGIFVPDGIYIENFPTYDPWVVLAAIAMRTERVRIGPMLTPVPRRRPWKLARETMTLDQLSNGRLILAVGLGTLDDGGFTKVGEPTERKVRAQRLDEGLEILAGLWSGQPFAYHGEQYNVEEMTFLPPPMQQPRIPVWVVGAWPKPRSMARAARWDGLLPYKPGDGSVYGAELTPDDIREMRTFIDEHRQATTPYDIVMEGSTPGDDPAKAAAIIGPFVEAGMTWWLESMWTAEAASTDVLTRIRQGPPRPIE